VGRQNSNVIWSKEVTDQSNAPKPNIAWWRCLTFRKEQYPGLYMSGGGAKFAMGLAGAKLPGPKGFSPAEYELDGLWRK